jgi:hypothetical protein
MVIAYRGPGVEKIRNHFAFLSLENYINQPSVVFGVSEGGFDIPGPKIKVTETNFQTDNEKSLPILKTFAVLAYHGAPFICHPCQRPGRVSNLVKSSSTYGMNLCWVSVSLIDERIALDN